MREDKLARLMFYGGCACLPWLWCVNIMYFRKQIFGPIPVWDTWLFRSDEDCDTVRAIDGPPALGAISGDGDEDENGTPQYLSFCRMNSICSFILLIHARLLRSSQTTETAMHAFLLYCFLCVLLLISSQTSLKLKCMHFFSISFSVCEEFHDDHSIPENLNEEVTKWVKRSTFGAASVLSIFVAWIVTFQLNKDSFPSSWFVMDEDEGEKTGW
mmetsp:Transcript_40711/g.122618  ORF Transcript_40711/g.122618 Transcript_40711/m.122618 type:complete len:214 (+) Transcript_40711:300-941(+)